MPNEDDTFYAAISRSVPASHYAKPGLTRFLESFVSREDRVLDAGCGIGVDAAMLASATHCRIAGFDTAIECVAQAAARGVRAVVADWNRDWPFAAGFDVVLAIFVIHHADDLRGFFGRAASVLKRRGAIVVLTATEADIRRRFLSRYFPGLVQSDIARYPAAETIEAALAAAGFAMESRRTVVLRTESVTPEYLDIVRNRRWASLRSLPEEEFRRGMESLERDAADSPAWENHKTLIVARRR